MTCKGILYNVSCVMPTRILFAVLMIVAGPALAPWFGTWKLNPAKSTTASDRFKTVTSRIEPTDDGVKVTYDMVGTRGGINHMEWLGKFDGMDYPVEGVDYVLTNAYTLLNDHSYQIVVKVDGVLAATTTVVISTDGKTLTALTKEKNAQGQDVSTTAVYDKQ
jgi:hypothetical protein